MNLNEEKTFTKESFLFSFYLKDIEYSRYARGHSIETFPFNESRCRILSKTKEISTEAKGILYWMIRDCRVQDNWAMIYAQQLALKNNIPLFVCFTIFEIHSLWPTKRHQQFLLSGLQYVEKQCYDLNIPFYLLDGSPEEMAIITLENNIGAIVTDFNPLREPKNWTKSLVKALKESIPIFQVDSHNIIPVWEASDKQEFTARTIRSKLFNKLDQYLTDFPSIIKHLYTGKMEVKTCTFDKASSQIISKYDVAVITDIKAGYEAGIAMLYSFLRARLKYYGISHNDPCKNHTSHLSFWLNFGHISVQRVALELNTNVNSSHYKEQIERYFESLIVGKELAENYCFYNENYDNFNGAPEWAQKTLLDHKFDQRPYLYSKQQFASAATHDECWNAAQLQLFKEGTIHRYLRMYWCKKILEWTKTPEEAVEIGIWLNNTFALDGNVPNSFVGVMWSICALHDLWYPERKVFGRIRWMVDYSLRQKYDMEAFCSRYGVEIKSNPTKEESSKYIGFTSYARFNSKTSSSKKIGSKKKGTKRKAY